MRRTAPFIPSSAEVHDGFKRVLTYAGLCRHLSNDSANSDDLSNSESDETSDSNDPPIDGAHISSVINAMRSPTQRTVNNYARHVR